MDAETAGHVRLLSVFHYVLAGLGLLFSLFPVLYMVFGWAMLTGAFASGGRPANPPPQVGWLFVAVGVVFLVVALGFAVLLALAGHFLARTRHWTYCMVIAALACAFFPLGTALGVFTILALSKPAVKAAFGVAPQPPERRSPFAERGG
jgi:hypothetical protein